MIMLSMFNEIVIILMMFVMPIGIPLSLLPFSLNYCPDRQGIALIALIFALLCLHFLAISLMLVLLMKILAIMLGTIPTFSSQKNKK